MDKQTKYLDEIQTLTQGYPNACTTPARLAQKEEKEQKDKGTSMADTHLPCCMCEQVVCHAGVETG